MSIQSGHSSTARHRSRVHGIATILALVVVTQGCRPPSKSTANPPATPSAESRPSANALIEQLADARIDAAKIKVDQGDPDEALALLVSALKADPDSAEAREMMESILRKTVWNFPILTLPHGQKIDQIAFAAHSSLWVSLAGERNTTVRWNLEKLRIEKVLFPVENCPTRSLVFGPQGRSVIVERGPATLLCDAQTLKPICDLGALPDFVTPSAVIVFSADGLLFAHPSFVSESDKSIVWHLRDAATGQTIRTSDPTPPEAPRPLAAHLDRTKLRILHADGNLLEVPISPVEPVQNTPMPEPAKLLNAQFSIDGNAVLALYEQGPHERPAQSVITYHDAEDGSLETDALMKRFPWSRYPNPWNGVMGTPENTPFTVVGNRLRLLVGPHSPVETGAPITAAAFGDNTVLTGTESGELTFHQLLPLPQLIETTGTSAVPATAADLAVIGRFCEGLAGLRYDEKERSYVRLAADERFRTLETTDFATVLKVFPMLDFQPSASRIAALRPRSPTSEAFLPLWDRLAGADHSGKSWPAILELSKDLKDTPWHRQLSAAAKEEVQDPGDSPWSAPSKIEAVFKTGDATAILAAIHGNGGKGPAAASTLALALKSGQPEWIKACLSEAVEIPPVLRQIAISHVDWLLGKKPAALSPWPENIPEMEVIRRREDWDGWEQADFKPALDEIRRHVQQELSALEVPADSTAEQRKIITERLENPDTVATIGKPRYAIACMKAAQAFCSFKDDAAAAFKLATTARGLGAPAEPCLRSQASALTAMGDYQKAHPLWIELLTEHPVESQIPGDYAEAAYTAFENADPGQAMIILTTGMHRYPQDANFALRAGWVALLTGNSERGYDFLKAGKRVGYPEEKHENATALLVIAAAQTGAYDDATVYFNDLLKIDEAWLDPKTLDTLDWPEELKSVLHQFMH